VAELFDAAHFLGEDGVGGDVAIEEGAAMASEQGGDAGGEHPEVGEQVGCELDVGGRPPGGGIGRCAEDE